MLHVLKNIFRVGFNISKKIAIQQRFYLKTQSNKNLIPSPFIRIMIFIHAEDQISYIHYMREGKKGVGLSCNKYLYF